MKTVNIAFHQINPLYLCILKYSGLVYLVYLEGVNPWAQRPKSNSLPTHSIPICWGQALQILRVQGAQEEPPKLCPIPNGAHLPWQPALLGHAQFHPTEEEAGIAAAWAEVLMFLMVSSRTPKCHKPCFPWKLIEVRNHITSWRNLLQALTDSLDLWAARWRPGWRDHSGPCPHAGSRSALAILASAQVTEPLRSPTS